MLDKPKKPYYIDNHGRGSYSQLAIPSIKINKNCKKELTMLEFLNFLTKSKKTNIATRIFQLDNIMIPIVQLGAWYAKKYKDIEYYNDSFLHTYYGMAILKSFYNVKNRYHDNKIDLAVLKNKQMINEIIENNRILKNFIEKGE